MTRKKTKKMNDKRCDCAFYQKPDTCLIHDEAICIKEGKCPLYKRKGKYWKTDEHINREGD